ncbi:acyl-CoA thioesterase [Mycolicibacterium hodleri]|uniref:Acyl-CoA thioesterase n=1 Tax=Mycolicibacterium hodleri TaxID=49897 RepID=A0A502EJD8_9MYCO|nr:thioesterase family protein [Mycolicibacterium hodleri]TPG36441.1 acyl-CoA thioesterase [Mycolicibacterium hodleri]
MIATIQIEPRWTDLDPVGHVNNSVFLVYAEEARNRFIHAILPTAWGSMVVVHSAIDYHHPIELHDRLEVTSAIEKIGTTSFTTVNVISTATHRCATVRNVQAVLNEDRSSARPWTADERAALEKLLSTGKQDPI